MKPSKKLRRIAAKHSSNRRSPATQRVVAGYPQVVGPSIVQWSNRNCCAGARLGVLLTHSACEDGGKITDTQDTPIVQAAALLLTSQGRGAKSRGSSGVLLGHEIRYS